MKCPGQDMQFWTAEAIYEVKCPQCDKPVEFYKDDTSRKCNHCGHRFVNPKMDFGCASYCQFAKQCLGDLPEEFVSQRESLLKDRVAIEMKRYFKNDFKRISHTIRVARHAEQIARPEDGNMAVILCASYLLNIGYPEATKKYGDKASEHLGEEGMPIAKDILIRLGAHEKLINSVCSIIDRHWQPIPWESNEFDIVHDAHLLAVLEEGQKKSSFLPTESDRLVRRLKTSEARREAEELLKKTDNPSS